MHAQHSFLQHIAVNNFMPMSDPARSLALVSGHPSMSDVRSPTFHALLYSSQGSQGKMLAMGRRAFQHIPVDEYQATLQQMVKDARAGGAKSILLITPPPVDDAARVTYNQQVSNTTSEDVLHAAFAWVRLHCQLHEPLACVCVQYC